MKKKLPLTIFFVLLILLFSYPAIRELLSPGYYSNHDGEGHIIRLAEFDLALKDGHFPPRLSKNLMYGYGFYFFNFNYPLVYWAGELVHLVGFNFVQSINIVTLLGIVLSGVTMFYWQRMHWGNWGALVAAVLYMYTPYRLMNVYVRGSVAEHIAFVMLPALFMFVEKIAEGQRRHRIRYMLMAGVFYALLMLSHNITAFIFTIILGLFMLFHVVLLRKPILLLYFAGVGVIGLVLSAFFWVPSILEKGYVRLDQTIARDYPDHFVFLQQLWARSWGYGGSGPGPLDGLSFQIGPPNLIFLVLSFVSIVFLWRNFRQKAVHLLFYLGIFLLSIFFMTSISKPLWDNVQLIAFTQFPWRFLSWSVFVTSALAGSIIFVLEKALQRSRKATFIFPLLVFLIVVAIINNNKDYFKVNFRVNINDTQDAPITGSTTWADEQFPKWFEPKPSSIPTNLVEVIGRGIVNMKTWQTAKHKYTLILDQDSKIVENTAYYPGWKVKINGKFVDVDYQDKLFPGRIVFKGKQGINEVITSFGETPIRLFVDLLSLSGALIVSLMIFLTYNFRKTWH